MVNGNKVKLTTNSNYKNPKIELINNWYVFYTMPRAEKVVLKELSIRGYEAFLPIQKKLRVWKNRQKKLVEHVLFPGYIFVNTKECELFKIGNLSKVVSIVHCAGKPSVIPIKDIERISKLLSLDQEISVESSFFKGDKVRITYGPLTGYEGILIKQNSKTRFGIQIDGINQTVIIDICVSLLEKK